MIYEIEIQGTVYAGDYSCYANALFGAALKFESEIHDLARDEARRPDKTIDWSLQRELENAVFLPKLTIKIKKADGKQKHAKKIHRVKPVLVRSKYAEDHHCGAITDSGVGEQWCMQPPRHSGPHKLA